MRILCLLLSHFPLQCECLRDPGVAGHQTVITCQSGSQNLILDYASELEGLQVDMDLQQALSRYDGLNIIHADIPYYWQIFNRLLDSLESVSPLIEGAAPGTVYIGVDGLQLIYPADAGLVAAVNQAVPETFSSQIGIAGSKFLAYLAARCSPPAGYKILEGDVSAFLRVLPYDILPVSLRSKKKLHDFGIRTLGQIAAMPPGPVQSQFGIEGKRIWELAQGRDATPLYPRGVDEVIEESTVLSSVTISLEALLVAVELLLLRGLARQCVRGRGVSSLTVWIRTWDARQWERKIQFKEPAMDIKSAMQRIKQTVENYPQPGPVEQVGIKINRLAYGTGRQKSIFAEVRANDHLLEDIKRLEMRLDGPQVFQVKEIEPWSRIPERRFGLAPLNP